jgi:hypothetical protein
MFAVQRRMRNMLARVLASFPPRHPGSKVLSSWHCHTARNGAVAATWAMGVVRPRALYPNNPAVKGTRP